MTDKDNALRERILEKFYPDEFIRPDWEFLEKIIDFTLALSREAKGRSQSQNEIEQDIIKLLIDYGNSGKSFERCCEDAGLKRLDLIRAHGNFYEQVFRKKDKKIAELESQINDSLNPSLKESLDTIELLQWNLSKVEEILYTHGGNKFGRIKEVLK